MTIAKADYIEGMAKGLAVLESFDTERQRLNATLAAQRAGLTRAAARRHLLTLAHLGYLETDGSYFWLAPKVLRFSGTYLASGLHLGARLPAHATSTGRVLLAGKSKGEFSAWLKGRELPRLTTHTVVDLKRFRAIVARVREADHCAASEEHELGVHALAVPLRNMEGRTVAAMNVVAAAARLDQGDLLPLLLDAA